jgi:hypothetical protein
MDIIYVNKLSIYYRKMFVDFTNTFYLSVHEIKSYKQCKYLSGIPDYYPDGYSSETLN